MTTSCFHSSLEMGVVKLVLPRHMYYRPLLPANRNWRRNFAVAWIQVATITFALYTGVSRWTWSTPKRGLEVAEDSKRYGFPIKTL